MISLLPACYKAYACPSVNLECPPCLPSLLCLPSITFARPAYPACRACCGLFVVLTPPVEAHLPMTHMLRSTYEPRSSLTKPLCAKPAYADTARHGPPSKYVILDAMMCANKVRQKWLELHLGMTCFQCLHRPCSQSASRMELNIFLPVNCKTPTQSDCDCGRG